MNNRKNEFTFGTILLTDNRRNYGSDMLVQEGNLIPNNKKARLGIAGLSINKSVLSDTIKAKFHFRFCIRIHWSYM